MNREVRAALRFMEQVSLTLFFVRSLDIEDAIERELPALLEQLAATEPATLDAWRVLGRAARHTLAALEEQGSPRAILARELMTEVMEHVDDQHAAALARQGEPEHGDDDAEA